MKVRLGLVSNSSASSYICTFGKVVDKEKFEAYCKANKVRFPLLSGYELATAPEWALYQNNLLHEFFLPITEHRAVESFLPISKVCEIAGQDPDSLYCLHTAYWQEDGRSPERDVDYETFNPKDLLLARSKKSDGFLCLEYIEFTTMT